MSAALKAAKKQKQARFREVFTASPQDQDALTVRPAAPRTHARALRRREAAHWGPRACVQEIDRALHAADLSMNEAECVVLAPLPASVMALSHAARPLLGSREVRTDQLDFAHNDLRIAK
jgi:hypothetical protein